MQPIPFYLVCLVAKVDMKYLSILRSIICCSVSMPHAHTCSILPDTGGIVVNFEIQILCMHELSQSRICIHILTQTNTAITKSTLNLQDSNLQL